LAGLAHFPCATSHGLIVPSQLPKPSILPSALNATCMALLGGKGVEGFPLATRSAEVAKGPITTNLLALGRDLYLQRLGADSPASQGSVDEFASSVEI